MSNENSMVKREDNKPEHMGTTPVTTPPVDLYENSEEVLLVADLPGVRSEDLDIQLNKDILYFSGRRILEESEQGEYRSVDYRREFRVGNEIDSAAISAKLKDGVLHLHLPKSEALKPRKIEVTAG